MLSCSQCAIDYQQYCRNLNRIFHFTQNNDRISRHLNKTLKNVYSFSNFFRLAVNFQKFKIKYAKSYLL